MNGRTGPGRGAGLPRLTVCVNDRGPGAITPSCGARGSLQLHEALAAEIASRGLDIELKTIRCLGVCEKGPNARLVPGNNWFHGLRPEDAESLVDKAEALCGN